MTMLQEWYRLLQIGKAGIVGETMEAEAHWRNIKRTKKKLLMVKYTKCVLPHFLALSNLPSETGYINTRNKDSAEVSFI